MSATTIVERPAEAPPPPRPLDAPTAGGLSPAEVTATNVSALPRATPVRGGNHVALAAGLIRAGGVVSFLLGINHLLFWPALDWPRSLAVLPADGAGIVQALNASITATMFVFAFVSLTYPRELHGPGLGRGLSIAIALFWVARAAEDVLFFGFSPFGVAIFLAIGALYGVPLVLAGRTRAAT